MTLKTFLLTTFLATAISKLYPRFSYNANIFKGSWPLITVAISFFLFKSPFIFCTTFILHVLTKYFVSKSTKEKMVNVRTFSNPVFDPLTFPK